MLKKLFFYVTMSFFMITIVPNAIAKNNQNIEKLSQKSPFSKFVKLIEESDRAVVYGENASLFTSYNGPQVVTDITDDIQRKRYGILQLSSSLNVYLDYISDPMGGTYEFINVKNNQVVGQIADPYNMTESLYINGAG